MFVYFVRISLLVCIFFVSNCLQQSCPVQGARVITDLSQKNCTDRATKDTAYYLDKKSCIPKCSKYDAEAEDECPDDPSVCISGYVCESRCGPGSSYRDTKCDINDPSSCDMHMFASCMNYCVLPDIDDNSDAVTCMAYHSNLPMFEDRWWKAKKFKPVCDNDGNWAPKQCKGGLMGRCLCYSASGIRLFGQALFADSANMTCACSRKKYELEAAGRTFVSLHCDSLGNYEPLQCDADKKLCWCVEPLTGELTAPFVPSSVMKKLPCYSVTNVGDQYLRQCESKKIASRLITAKLKAHGVVSVESDTLLCDADGSFGAYSIQSGIAYCTWRDNSKIGTWQVNVGDTNTKLTCNCARDFKMYEHTQSCDGNGNYVDLQKYIKEDGTKKYYCVDEDGFAKSDMLDDPKTNCTYFF